MKIGIDSVEVKRINKILKTKKNIDKIYSVNEILNINNCNHKAQRASGYFAVKEAFVKALNIGFNGEIALNEITVSYSETGSPQIELTTKINKLLNKYGFNNVEINITHTQSIATAVCLLY